MEVDRVRTEMTPTVYAVALLRAWREIYSALPTKAQAGVIYGQWMVETAGKYTWNWNIGNVKVTQAQVDAGVDWMDLPTFEFVNGQKIELAPGDPGRRFRAFPSLDVAMTSHLEFLRNKRYAPSWPRVEAGDPDGFARALKKQGYYTANEDDYARLLVAFHRRWINALYYEDACERIAREDEALPGDYRPEPEPAIVHPDVPLSPDSPDREPAPDDEGGIA